MRLPKNWTPHKVIVEQFLGEGANGALTGEPVEVPDVYVKDQAEIVRDDTGAEVVSRASVRFNLGDLPKVGSKITIWPDTRQESTAVMFKASRLDHPGWPSLGIGWLQ